MLRAQHPHGCLNVQKILEQKKSSGDAETSLLSIHLKRTIKLTKGTRCSCCRHFNFFNTLTLKLISSFRCVFTFPLKILAYAFSQIIFRYIYLYNNVGTFFFLLTKMNKEIGPLHHILIPLFVDASARGIHLCKK
ncbi:unnamed protein product, partial [Amoebophrya sp. A25]|eukprot:GSA25T00001099001.1